MTVFVNGRRTATGTGRSALINLRGLPAGKVSVKVVAVRAAGRPLVLQRSYKTCAAKRRR